jgi:hypothetical protein
MICNFVMLQYKFGAYAETPHDNLPMDQITRAKRECWAAEVLSPKS